MDKMWDAKLKNIKGKQDSKLDVSFPAYVDEVDTHDQGCDGACFEGMDMADI